MRFLILSILLIFSISTNAFSQNKHQVRKKNANGNSVGINYFKGDIVETGFGIEYLVLRQSDNSKVETGFGLTFNYFDVLNTEKYLDGTFAGFNPKFVVHYFLDKKNVFLLGGEVALAFGSETIEDDETNFFIGPHFNEYIGILLDEKLLLKAGGFQLWYFGSDVLPDDLGFYLGANVRF